MNGRKANGPTSPTNDHIRPKAWDGTDEPDNVKICCRQCNEWRALSGHCLGVLACARQVAMTSRQPVQVVLRGWRLPPPIPPGFDMESFTTNWREVRQR